MSDARGDEIEMYSTAPPLAEASTTRRPSRRVVRTLLILGAIVCGAFWLLVKEEGELTTPQVGPPSHEVAALADRAMTAEGRRIFFSAGPTILEREEFASVCGTAEHRVILGCYKAGRIYILRVVRAELSGVMEVTAAHEMLHAAYSRLSESERRRVIRWVHDFYAGVRDERFRKEVQGYGPLAPDDLADELHALLPTELSSLNPVLDKHYKRYLSTRGAVVAAFEGFRSVFEDLDRQWEERRREVLDLRSQLDALHTQADADEAALEELNARLDALKTQGRIRAYNDLIPEQNARVDALRGLVDQYDRLVETYNAKVDQLDALALEENRLLESLRARPPAPSPGIP